MPISSNVACPLPNQLTQIGHRRFQRQIQHKQDLFGKDITTRCPRITFAKRLRLGKLEDLRESLAILARRSSREIERGQND
jgi:hypothetical protein